VPRPKVPLSTRKTLEAALRIIDAEGLDALSVRRLAIELNVNGASLYHHFKNKEEILVGAAKLALEAVRTPATAGDEDWRVWLMRNGDRLRQALVAHPDLIQIMMRRELLGIGVAELDVPIEAVAPILDFGELLAIVTAMAETSRSSSGGGVSPEYTHLHKAIELRGIGIGDLFAETYLAGVDAIVNKMATTPPSSRRAAKQATAKPRKR
jgi:TetR/AcrR family tetracycline transcriptional repressor